jgi:hypothetical protein
MKVEELAEAISRFVNGASSDKVEKLAELMAQDHPTLQQNKMRLACLFIEQMVNKPYTDARNETSKKNAIAMITGYKVHAEQEIINQDGDISASLKKYIEEEALPSKSLPTI